MSIVLSHDDWSIINEIVVRMNQANDTIAALQSFLKDIERLIPYEKSSVFFYSFKNDSFKVDKVLYRFFTEKELQDYNEYYCQLDEIIWHMMPKRIKTIRNMDVLDPIEREKTEYYVDYMKQVKTHFSLDSNFVWRRNNNAINFGSVDLFRSKGSINFSEKELAIFEIMRPHVENLAVKYVFSYDDLLKGIINKYAFTKTEEDIAKLILKGFSNKMIANKMFVTVSTIKKHVANILEKTGSKSRVDFICKTKNIKQELVANK